LERAQGYLKLPNGRALTGQSHDYKRHGTTTLFAALNVASGEVRAKHYSRRQLFSVGGPMHLVRNPPPRAENAAANARARSVAAPIAQSGTAEIHRRGPKMRPTFFGRARGLAVRSFLAIARSWIVVMEKML